MDIFKFPLLLAISFFGLLAANWGVDPAYRFHGFVIALVAFWVFIMMLRQVGEPPRNPRWLHLKERIAVTHSLHVQN
jgi:hypothetical protein